MVVKFSFSNTLSDITRTLSMEYDGEPGVAFDAVVITFMGQWDESGRVIMTSRGTPVFGSRIGELSKDIKIA